ncbi:MAG: type III pantothenate kinase [Candidatus Omnitrophica bacterium]|nr:type III pantothenate kinase [Candidatus Omnitrophota bacterium]
MLLAIDIGNTNISIGIFQGTRLLRKDSISTASKSYLSIFRRITKGKAGFEAVICSVVPTATRILQADLGKLGIRPYIIGKDIRVPIRNLYRKPGQVGQDRLVNAYAAVQLFGSPIVAIDFGTAITFDVISKKGEYLGGMILPGLGISLNALAKRTALLPEVKLRQPEEFIGRDTQNSILSGVIFGFAALTDKFSSKLKQKFGSRTKIIATGGNSGFMSKFCTCFDRVDPELTLKGLMLLEKKYKKNS